MRELPTLKDITSMVASINSAENIENLLSSIIGKIKLALYCEGCSILLYNKEEDCLYFNTVEGDKSESLLSMIVPKGFGIAGYVMEKRVSILDNDAQNNPLLFKEIDKKINFKTRNIMAIPMIAHGEFIGIVESVNTVDGRDFDKKELDLFKNLSEIAANAIYKHKLIDHLKKKDHENKSLLKISKILNFIDSEIDFFKLSGDSVLEILAAEKASLFFRKNIQSKFKLVYIKGSELSVEILEDDFLESRILEFILKFKKHLLIENTEKEQTFHFQFLNSSNYQSKSFISMPLLVENEILGIINVTDKKDKKSFDQDDVNLLTILINSIMETYKVMKAKQDRLKYDLMERELKIAKQIQLNSLPEIPDFSTTLEIDKAYYTSRGIGGDFYDFIVHSPTLISIVIADVSGKGIPAALYMEYSKTILSNELFRTNSTSESLKNSHLKIQNSNQPLMHVEVMIVQIDLDKKEIRLSSGGHNRQFYFNNKSKTTELLRARGIPIGSRLPFLNFSEESFYYNKGDTILLYTDGITEIKNSNSEMFGEERLLDLFTKNIDEPISQIKEIILKNLLSFSDEEKFDDDYTLIIFRLNE
jgi:phosphoserine phosphatase RsbU/P